MVDFGTGALKRHSRLHPEGILKSSSLQKQITSEDTVNEDTVFGKEGSTLGDKSEQNVVNTAVKKAATKKKN